MSKFIDTGRKTLGYTIDQTILVVAVIAILITLIIASVGWDLITRAGGTKLASYLKQIEDANGSFYGRHRMWPDTALDADGNTASSSDANLLILKQNLFGAGRWSDNHQNLLPGFDDDGTNLISPFGDGAQIMTFDRHDHAGVTISDSFTGGFSWVLQIPGVTEEEAIRADIAIDNSDDMTNTTTIGRLILIADGDDCFADGNTTPAAIGDGLVTLCYIANSI